MNALAFELPVGLEAAAPQEAWGTPRDGVRLMVAERAEQTVAHATFVDLPDILAPGDLLVVNVSATLPAALRARRADGSIARLHISTRAPALGPSWRIVELRSADGAHPDDGADGEELQLTGGGRVTLELPYASGRRLMLARFSDLGGETVEAYLAAHGQPIRYGYVGRRWPLEAYQNVYATEPGSAEMPSAGRPFTEALITRLLARGILIAPLTLHTGVSSPERHEGPFPEYFSVPATTARLVDAVKEWGGRVIAVGTTVVRALETIASAASAESAESADDGCDVGAGGWTDLRITPDRGVWLVDGLITGWHEPEASHLEMLEAIAGRELLERCYDAALGHGYLWHEFGDSHLILP
jgi:S-adenosylmethionine:tRNA ribosyltransferase-isomerase